MSHYRHRKQPTSRAGGFIVAQCTQKQGETGNFTGVSLDDAWEITRALSVRATVRVAARTATGEALNDYDHEHRIDSPAPTAPWAMYLSGDRRNFDYLCFDFDASRGNAVYDAGRFSHWLDELNIEHLVCQSGPTGGRHVWIAPDAPILADDIRALANLAGQLLPSLDPSPLSNPVTGCVRPPGAPHRSGGASTPLGNPDVLTRRAVTAEAIADLAAFLVDIGAELPAPATAPLRGMTVDADGHPRMSGLKRPLTSRVAALLDERPDGDASYVLTTILAGCAHARWSYADVRELLRRPALEHARTRRGRGGARIPRSAHEQSRVLTAAWHKAVRYVAANPLEKSGDDPEYRARLQNVTATVQRAQERADAMPGLWDTDRSSRAARSHRGTYSSRAVLDAICLYMLQSAQPIVEADIRRLSADTGYGRTTVHTALRALTTPLVEGAPESAWLVRVGEPVAPHGQRYRLSKRFSTEDREQDRTQALARPAPPPPSLLPQRLATRLQLLAHDTFAAPGSLGRTAGMLYQQLPQTGTATVTDLSQRTGLSAHRVRQHLERLATAGLAGRIEGGWRAEPPTTLDSVAEQLHVAGYLAQRRDRYDDERSRWAWWSAEMTWMRKPGKKRKGRRSPTKVALFPQDDRPEFPRYPRGPDGMGDHRAALQLIQAGALRPAVALAA